MWTIHFFCTCMTQWHIHIYSGYRFYGILEFLSMGTFIWHIVTFTHPGNYFIDIIQFRNSCTFVSHLIRLGVVVVVFFGLLFAHLQFYSDWYGPIWMLFYNTKKANDSLFYVARCWRSSSMERRHVEKTHMHNTDHESIKKNNEKKYIHFDTAIKYHHHRYRVKAKWLATLTV